jgi:hypothetical protein
MSTEQTSEWRIFLPKVVIEQAGYGAVWRGQKSWNGVPILAPDCEPIVTSTELPGEPADKHRRYIEAAVGALITAGDPAAELAQPSRECSLHPLRDLPLPPVDRKRGIIYRQNGHRRTRPFSTKRLVFSSQFM